MQTVVTLAPLICARGPFGKKKESHELDRYINGWWKGKVDVLVFVFRVGTNEEYQSRPIFLLRKEMDKEKTD